jgi:Adenylate and Guanylate cyclase catalytic domain
VPCWSPSCIARHIIVNVYSHKPPNPNLPPASPIRTHSRHESTGEPDRIHISDDTHMELYRTAPDKFKIEERGLVPMKGKGELRTFWLRARPNNKLVNRTALDRLDGEVRDLLESTSFDYQNAKDGFGGADGLVARRSSQEPSNGGQHEDRREQAATPKKTWKRFLQLKK